MSRVTAIKRMAGLLSGDDPLSAAVKRPILVIQEFTFLALQAFRAIFSRPLYVRDILLQMDRIGVGSLFIVLLTGIFTGMVLALQMSVQLEAFGATNYVGRVVSASVIRELGPVLAALMVAGRVGAGIASELGSMTVTEQIDALKAEGTDPIKKLVVPRLLACMVMIPALTAITDAVAILGGFVIAVFTLRVDGTFYWTSVFYVLDPKDFISGLAKPLVFGFLIAMVGCFSGFRVTGGTEGVGNATTRSVVAASILILATDFFMTKFFMAVL